MRVMFKMGVKYNPIVNYVIFQQAGSTNLLPADGGNEKLRTSYR